VGLWSISSASFLNFFPHLRHFTEKIELYVAISALLLAFIDYILDHHITSTTCTIGGFGLSYPFHFRATIGTFYFSVFFSAVHTIILQLRLVLNSSGR
jgi:hypothetical protein